MLKVSGEYLDGGPYCKKNYNGITLLSLQGIGYSRILERILYLIVRDNPEKNNAEFVQSVEQQTAL